ncbi:MAG TPA: hypothetical protein VL461_15405 [Dictyobacter sp.]|nr:hypothetical protein [Dictyobacter sp.]
MYRLFPPPSQRNIPSRVSRAPGQLISSLLTILIICLSAAAILRLLLIMHTTNSITITESRCQKLIHNTDYTQVIPFRSQSQTIDAIQFTDDLTEGQPSALIQLRDDGPQQRLDVYLYGCALHKQQPTLQLLLKRQGLIEGSVSITQAHTLSIGQQDPTLPDSSSDLLLPLQQDIYREYSWRNNMLQQTLFPGLYPVSSRSEAEALQDQANNGEAAQWTDPLSTARQMAHDLLALTAPQLILKEHNTQTAHVLLKQKQLTITVTLTRLLQQDKKGIWFVTAAQTAGIQAVHQTIRTTSQAQLQLTGTINPDTRQIYITLFDHTLTPIRLHGKPQITVGNRGIFNSNIPFINKLSDQPGLALLQTTTHHQNSDQIYLTKVLLP